MMPWYPPTVPTLRLLASHVLNAFACVIVPTLGGKRRKL